MKLLAIFWDTDFRARHEGLLEKARNSQTIARRHMHPDDMLCFINAKRDRVIILTGLNDDPDAPEKFGVLAYYRSKGRIEPTAIQYIPDCFNGENINYNSALKKALEKNLAKRSRVVTQKSTDEE